MPAIRAWSEWGAEPPLHPKLTDAAFRTFVMLGRDPRWTLVTYENPDRNELEFRVKGPNGDQQMLAVPYQELRDEVVALDIVNAWIERVVPLALPKPPVVQTQDDTWAHAVEIPRQRTQVFPVTHEFHVEQVRPAPQRDLVEPRQGVRKIDLE